MLRRVVYGMALVLLAAALGGVLWLKTGTDATPESDFRLTQRLMIQWSHYAEQVSVRQDKILDSPSEVVELMNTHSAQAFGGRKLRFVLWQTGDAPVPGYQLNPDAEDRKESHESINVIRHSPEYWRKTPMQLGLAIPGLVDPEPSDTKEPARRNTLEEQTTSYLLYHQYRTCLSGDRIFVFPRDVFLPRLVTRKLYVLSGGMMRWLLSLGSAAYTVEADGRWNIQPFLERQSVQFAPGASALYDPKEEAATLTLDEDNLEMAELTSFSGGCTGGAETASSKAERFQIKFWYWRQEHLMWLREHLGLPPPGP